MTKWPCSMAFRMHTMDLTPSVKGDGRRIFLCGFRDPADSTNYMQLTVSPRGVVSYILPWNYPESAPGAKIRGRM